LGRKEGRQGDLEVMETARAAGADVMEGGRMEGWEGITTGQTYLEVLTSAPCSINSFATRSFPPDDAACRGRTPCSNPIDRLPMREGEFDERRPTFSFAAAECRPRYGTLIAERLVLSSKRL
jgi:hypothetical protein